MASRICHSLTLSVAFFVLFALNTWLLLQDSVNGDEGQRSSVNLDHQEVNVNVMSRRKTKSIGSPGDGNFQNEVGLILAPEGVRAIKETGRTERTVLKCRTLLLSKGYSVKQDDTELRVDQVQTKDGHHLADSRRIMDTAETRDVTRSSALVHPLLMRTDDAHTIQSKPWGELPHQCSSKDYGDLEELGKVSVIICFHENEQLAEVLRTVHSIIQRTPPEMLQEILLIDDNSKKEDFKHILDQYIRVIFGNHNVKVIRSRQQLGLIQCRLRGAREARGDVIYFMDSHMEVRPQWLEPLLWEIKLNPKTLATSYLDWMERDYNGTWKYKHGASSWKTYFDWNFVFGFQMSSYVGKSPDQSDPVRCPVTVGGVFAINRTFFFEIGAFDEEMWGWGGENLDLPIRVWLFGGRVVNVPCSHVGHLEMSGSRNYRLSWQRRIHQNYKRVTETWLGEYKKYFYYYNPTFKDIDPGNLTSRLELQKRAPRSFSWILENVFPELGIYDKDSFAWDGLRNIQFDMCLWATAPTIDPILRSCNKNDTSHQGFFLNDRGELRFPIHVFNARGSKLQIQEYIGQYKTGISTRWIHWPGGPMKVYSTNNCLEASDKYSVTIKTCDMQNPKQKWVFNTYNNRLSELFKSNPAPEDDSYVHALYHEHLQADGNIQRA